MTNTRFENVVRRNLRRSFRTTVILLLIVGILCGGNGAGLIFFKRGFTMGLFDTTISGIVYLGIWVLMMFGVSTITTNGFRRSYELFLSQLDKIGKREEVLDRVNRMPKYELAAAPNAVLLFDSWGFAYAYHESFAVIPCDHLLKTRITAMVKSGDPNAKPLRTELVVAYKGDEELRIPVKDREEAQALIAKMEAVFPHLNK